MIFSVLTICSFSVAELAQEEKLSAVRRGLGGESLFTNPWFILTGASVVFILMLLLVLVQHSKIERAEADSELQFERNCERYGLSEDERTVLCEIARQSGIRGWARIFSEAEMFERGVVYLLQSHFAAGRTVAQRKELNLLVDSVKSKIGFKKRVEAFGVGSIRRKLLSSRSIPAGKEVVIVPAFGNVKSTVNAVVMENSEHELVLHPEISVRSSSGEVWKVQYEFGSACWEFEAAVIDYSEDSLVLHHSDGIEFVNRRRFLRVEVEKEALIAPFPMVRGESYTGTMEPDFVTGKVTELSGPGLRIESGLRTLVGDRVMVVFELEPGRFFEDVGVVRWCKERLGGSSMGVELIGLSDSGVDELVRATNREAIDSRMLERSVEREVGAVEETVHG